MKKVIICSAPSGSGKTTLVRSVLQEIPQLAFSISACTRKPREGEVNGKDYYFLKLSDFCNRINNGEFIEYEEVYPGNFYGTLKAELNRLWDEGKVAIFDVDVVGGVRLKSIFKDQALSIFIAPPSIPELERRLQGRGTDSPEVIATRMAKAEKELSYKKDFDCCIINDDLKKAKIDIHTTIKNFLDLE